MPGLGAGALRLGRDGRLRLRPAPRRGDDGARAGPGAADRAFPTLGRAPGPRPPPGPARLRRRRRVRPHRPPRHRDDRAGPALHLRARPQPGVLRLCRRPGRQAGPAEAGGRHVRDRLLGLSRLPARDPRRHAGGAQPRHGARLLHRDAADVADQGADLGPGQDARRRTPDRPDSGGHPHLLPRRTRPAPRMGLRLRDLPGLRTAAGRLRGLERAGPAGVGRPDPP